MQRSAITCASCVILTGADHLLTEQRRHLLCSGAPQMFLMVRWRSVATETRLLLQESRCHFATAPFSSSTPQLMRKFRGKRGAPRKREAQEGDWLCACGETNYKSKRECFKCGAPAPPLPPGVRRPSLPGEDPKDWACPCGQMNFRGSVVCYRCKQPKPAPPTEPGQEVTMWKCGKCSNINRSVRKFCFKCFSPCPLAPAPDPNSLKPP